MHLGLYENGEITYLAGRHTVRLSNKVHIAVLHNNLSKIYIFEGDYIFSEESVHSERIGFDPVTGTYRMHFV